MKHTFALDADLMIPKEIMDAAILIDNWARMQGWEHYAIGPIRNRFPQDVRSDIRSIRDRLDRIEQFLVL